MKDFNEMATELLKVYSSRPNPLLLYANDKSRWRHYGVYFNDDQNYHCFRRLLVIGELPNNNVEVYFIDYGNSRLVVKDVVLA